MLGYSLLSLLHLWIFKLFAAGTWYQKRKQGKMDGEGVCQKEVEERIRAKGWGAGEWKNRNTIHSLELIKTIQSII